MRLELESYFVFELTVDRLVKVCKIEKVEKNQKLIPYFCILSAQRAFSTHKVQ